MKKKIFWIIFTQFSVYFFVKIRGNLKIEKETSSLYSYKLNILNVISVYLENLEKIVFSVLEKRIKKILLLF